MPAAARICSCPMRVIWSTFSPNSGELASTLTRSLHEGIDLGVELRLLFGGDWHQPAACSGATCGTGSGGVSEKSVAVAV
jgi:hypothetical protein